MRYLDGFDAEGSRMTERMWRAGQEDSAVTQALRCYSPADLRLLVEGTGINLDSVEPYADESYGASSPMGDSMLYLARLVPK